MNIAVCADFMYIDLLVKKIQKIYDEKDIQIDEFTDTDHFIDALHCKKYNTAVVALNGSSGFECIARTRWISKDIFLIWIIDNERFVNISYRLDVDRILFKNFSDEEMATAMVYVKTRVKSKEILDSIEDVISLNIDRIIIDKD